MITEAQLSRIENDLHAGPSFVNAFKPLFCEEQAMFLLAVVKFKKNPTWDGLLSVYHKHISNKSQLQANIKSSTSQGIESFVKRWGDSQKAFKDQGVNLHVGTVPSDILDKAFAEAISMFDAGDHAVVCQKFLADFHVT